MNGDAPPKVAAGVLRPDETARRLGFSIVTLARWRVQGTGPAFVKLGAQRVGYRESDLEAWLASRARRSTADGADRAS